MEPPRRTIRRRHTLGDRPKSQPSLSKRDQQNLAPAAKWIMDELDLDYFRNRSEFLDRWS